jgi:hypothetical protein
MLLDENPHEHHPCQNGVSGPAPEAPEAEPFKPSSPSVELDPARLAPELRAENARLHQLLEQGRKRLAQVEQQNEQWRSREQVYENLLEEKSELIRTLHVQLNELKGRAQPEAQPGAAVPNEEELIALHQELEREREQLKQDEDSLMEQMRTMEVQMASERAVLARQRNELQRLQNELQHQLELASRDAAMRERLGPLYRLQEELQNRPSGQSGVRHRPVQASGNGVAPPTAQVAPAQAPPAANRSSGFFRRMFGKE